MLGPTQRVPLRGSSSPASTRASTVLPAPFGPTTPTRSPRVITSSTSSSTGSSPNAKSACSSASTRWPPRARAAQLERHLAPLEHRPVDLLHRVDLHLLDARLLGRALVDGDVRPVAEAPHRLLEPGDLLALRDPLLLLALELEPARDRVGGVGAGPDADLAAVELGDVVHALVEQVAVVGDHQHGAVEVVDQVLERVAAAHVEVRLGLVEQQQPGPPREAGRERDELALAAAELARGAGERVVVEPERGQVRRAPRSRRARRRAPTTARAAAPGWRARARACACRRRAQGRRGGSRPGRARAPARSARAARRARWRARRGRRPRRSAAARRARARGGW